MNLIDALRKSVLEYPGSYAAVAAQMGVSYNILRNKLSPANQHHKLTIHELEEVISITGDVSAIQVLADHFGLVVAEKATVEREKLSGLYDSMLDCHEGVACVTKKVREAAEDGIITPEEAQRIKVASRRQRQRQVALEELIDVLVENEEKSLRAVK